MLFRYNPSPLALRCLQNLGLLRDQFPGVSVPSYFSPASNTNFFISFSTSQFKLNTFHVPIINIIIPFFLAWFVPEDPLALSFLRDPGHLVGLWSGVVSPTPNLELQDIPLVWVITLDLSGKGDLASSYATAGVSLRIV